MLLEFKPTTVYPTDPLPEGRWMRFISGIDLNPDEIDTSSILGASIKDGYNKNPELVVKELKMMYRDNAKMVEKIIGENNVKLLK